MEITTPIWDYVKDYNNRDAVRAHMPGHKGRGFLGVEGFDITEINEELCLYEDNEGIVRESLSNARKVFDSGRTFYSAEGSSLGIKAMLYACFMRKVDVKNKYILAGRNIHHSFVDGCAMLGIDVYFMEPSGRVDSEFIDSCICECNLSGQDVMHALKEVVKKEGDYPIGIYLTSPDYLGNILDIGEISRAIEEYNSDIPILVDNAHGAYLAFLEEDKHPIHNGAWMCADSAHKTLSALTGAAYVHLSKERYQEFEDFIFKGLQGFGSTSPSFLVSASLDCLNHELATDYRDKLKKTVDEIKIIKKKLREMEFFVKESEPLKITVLTNKKGFYLKEELARDDIYVEYADEDYLVMMLSVENSSDDFQRILKAFRRISIQCKCDSCFGDNSVGENSVGKNNFGENSNNKNVSISERIYIRRNYFCDSEEVDVLESLGRISAECSASCPPAVPVILLGEKISEEMICRLKKYKVEKIRVSRL